jgi:hypothetical protein
MSALFAWKVSPKRKTSEGDRKTVTRFLWWPTTIRGECRWLGFEDIDREAYIGWVCPPEMKAYRGIKWRNVAWTDYEPIRYQITEKGRALLDGAK